ncbi:MAG TPA: ankyrin repeat domain-containing protein [Candidatus Polarisedimenticolia bacterium]|nr:ankyrin repeat domain-containing protein [Candidatus Polarisedimenticolia bacterium]
MPEITDLFGAIQTGDAAKLGALLAESPALATGKNERGDSPLLTAAYMGRRDMVDSLLAAGVEPTLWEAAAIGLKEAAVERLRREPASIGAHSHDGWTPLHLAAFFGHHELAALLLERGADVNARSKSATIGPENTPLHAACANKQVEVARLLVERGADVNARDGSGFTPLALAANSKSDVLMLLLLENGARAD